jgi:hypothetical protein
MNKNWLTSRHRLGAQLTNLRSRGDGLQSLVIKPTIRPRLAWVAPMVNYYVELFVGAHGDARTPPNDQSSATPG